MQGPSPSGEYLTEKEVAAIPARLDQKAKNTEVEPDECDDRVEGAVLPYVRGVRSALFGFYRRRVTTLLKFNRVVTAEHTNRIVFDCHLLQTALV